MNVDTAIQDMLFNWGDEWVRITAELARTDRETCFNRYQIAYDWSIEQCNEFLDNICLAFDLVVKDKPPAN